MAGQIPPWAQDLGATDQGLQNYRRRRAGGAPLGEDPVTYNGQPVGGPQAMVPNEEGQVAGAINDITQRQVTRNRPGNRGGQTQRNRQARNAAGGGASLDPMPAPVGGAPGLVDAGRTGRSLGGGAPSLRTVPTQAQAPGSWDASAIRTRGSNRNARGGSNPIGPNNTLSSGPTPARNAQQSRPASSAFSRSDLAGREAARQALIASRGQAPAPGVGGPAPAPTPIPTPIPTTTGAPPPGPTLSTAPAPAISPDLNPGQNPQRGRPTPGPSPSPGDGGWADGGMTTGVRGQPSASDGGGYGGGADMNPRPWNGGGGAAGGASDGWPDGGGPTSGGGQFGGSDGGGQASDGLPVAGGPQVSNTDPMQPNPDEMRRVLLGGRGRRRPGVGNGGPIIPPAPVY